jgi:DNA-binding PadR family transcriptional regulator
MGNYVDSAGIDAEKPPVWARTFDLPVRAAQRTAGDDDRGGKGEGGGRTRSATAPIHEQLCSRRRLACLCALLLLHDQPGHGYDLVLRLDRLGFQLTPSRVYRSLRWLREAELVEPSWEMSTAGPARRTFTLSIEGREALAACVPRMLTKARPPDPSLTGLVIDRLARLGTLRDTFTFEIAAHLTVEAEDELSARHKLETLFRQSRLGAADIRLAELPSDPVLVGRAGIRCVQHTPPPAGEGDTDAATSRR